jgi:hypothetical protein
MIQVPVYTAIVLIGVLTGMIFKFFFFSLLCQQCPTILNKIWPSLLQDAVGEFGKKMAHKLV